MTRIHPLQIETGTAYFVEAKPKNESLVKVNYYDEQKIRIASRLILIPSNEELSDETIWKNADVKVE